MTDQTRNAVIRLIAEHAGISEADVKPESYMGDDLGFDSLDNIELVIAIEEAFGIELHDEDFERLGTVGDVLSHVDSVIWKMNDGTRY